MKAPLIAAAIAVTTVFLVPTPVAGSGGEASAEYAAPSSFRVQPILGIPIIGFGAIACKDAPAFTDATGLSNGACFEVAGHLGHEFQVVAVDDVFGAQVSISVAIDWTGTGCASPNCGLPEHARWSNCGTVTGILPEDSKGTALWVFVRAVDVDPTTRTLCMASRGTIHIVY